MALVPPLDATPDEVRALLAPLRSKVSVALHAPGNPFAVGAIVRVAHSFLVREIVVVGDAPHYPKASMGMEKYESIVRVADDDAFFAHVAGRPVWAIEKDLAQKSLYDVTRFPDDVVLVFGSERHGLTRAFAERCDAVIGIPMYGVNHSFPLAVACGMVLGEWGRQAHARGRVF